ncbi:N-acetyltransferase family protein [Scytonema sp. NUACC26]|uniref:GNAT family N-acetyltransferase n=1 Tax=Scytonema sp. NUACC26 TaxID=3140176 RepID=UPI0034DC91DF
MEQIQKPYQVNIRPGEIKDAERMTILCKELGYPVTLQEIQQRLASIQRNKTHAIYVATLADDYVVAWAHAHICDTIISPTQAILFGLIVDESYRHCGIGSLLMQHIEHWALLNNCQGVLFRSNIKRKEAHSFYERIGYTNIKQSLTFQKVLT